MPAFDLSVIGRGLAFASAMPALEAALDASPVAVVTAAPGTGKTTLVPPAVANRVNGRVIVTQPRRVAARAAARRLATLDSTALGDRVGFTVRGERSVSADTVIEMVTPGVLLRRLIDDPALDGTDAVIIDEVHERALDTDLLLGLLGEVRELRDDLALVAMSATVDAERFATLLGDAPIVTHDAVAHPLDVRWAPYAGDRLDDRGVTPGFLRHVAATTEASLSSLGDVDALVFAPGAREVGMIARTLRETSAYDVLELHGQASAKDQDRAVAGRSAGEGPRIIVATSIAESSLTVPGVRLVVDTCLSRVPRRDALRGMTGLVTVSTPRASAVQRAGRAARLGPGTVVRCVDERTFAAAPAFATPEIATTDLTEAALLLSCWGTPGGRGLALPDPLPAEALRQAESTLRGIGATDDDGRATALGARLARVPADPRLARALLDGALLIGARTAAEIVALVSGDIRTDDGDLAVTLRALRDGRHPSTRAWKREADRFERLARGSGTAPVSGASAGGGRAMTSGATSPDVGAGDAPPTAPRRPSADARNRSVSDALGLVVALAFPDRIARRMADADGGAVYLLASGTRAGLSGSLASAPWIAVADVTRAEGRAAAGTGAVIRAAAAIGEEDVELAAEHLLTDRVEVAFDGGRVVARREKRVGAIVRASVPVKVIADDATAAAVRRALADEGLGMFRWSDAGANLRARMALLHRELGEPWPDVSDAGLLARLDEWLGPEIRSLAGGVPAAKIDLLNALRRLLPWPEAARLDELAPERLAVPSGSNVRIDYAHEQPVVAVKLQECFGFTDTPRLAGERVPVLFHLLSPGGHPLAVTADLASFWAGPYAQVRAEMRGRYPKHPWPEDPMTHVATAKTNRRLREG